MSRPVPPGLSLGVIEPKDAVAAFERRDLLLPSFKWHDVWQQENLRGFAVAGVMRHDILQLIHDELGVVQQAGGVARSFVDRARERLQAKGFWGNVEVTHPVTGDVRTTKFSDARLRLIFDTNLAVSYAAGKAERFERSKKYFPYLRYVTRRDDRVRESHQPWDGVTLPHDHPWWTLHKPIKAWRCRCDVEQLSERQVQRLQKSGARVITEPPADEMIERIDPRSGKALSLPRGVDAAFAYDIGKRPMRGAVPEALMAKDPYSSRPTLDPARAMPAPRPANASQLLPVGTDPVAAVDRFLAEFGAARGKPALYTDKLGDAVVISEELFLDGAMKWKFAQGGGRELFLPLLARAIREPDEIWAGMEHHRIRDVDVLRRRYFARYRIDGQDQPMVAVFETGKDGWIGVTTFQADETASPSQQRGTLKRMRRGRRLFVRGGLGDGGHDDGGPK